MSLSPREEFCLTYRLFSYLRRAKVLEELVPRRRLSWSHYLSLNTFLALILFHLTIGSYSKV